MKKSFITYVGISITLLLLFLLTPAFASAKEFSESELVTALCDINSDNKVNISDARLLLRAAVQIDTLSVTQSALDVRVKKFGDLNGDSIVSISDARILLRHAVSIEYVNSRVRTLVSEEPGPIENPDLDKVLVQNTLLTPYSSHGLGKARMCEVSSDYAETSLASVEDSKSNPLCSPFVKGTYDYIKDVKTYGEDIYYTLASGRKLETEFARELTDAYVMPLNNVSATAVYTSSASTDIYIKTDWLVPTGVTYTPQSYTVGYDSRPWNLGAFTVNTMNIVFSYTTSGTGSLRFSAGSPLISGEWIDNGNETVSLKLLLKETGGAYGYSISVSDRGYFKISLKHKSESLKGKIVMLDAGHGGADGGAAAEGVPEKIINLAVALEAKKILEGRGAKVMLTRAKDVSVSLEERVDLCRSSNADVFVSLHCDSSSPSVHGTHVFYYYPQSMPLAKLIQQKTTNAYRTGIYAENEDMQNCDLGIKFYPFQVARVEQCPAVLVEMGFITNAVERETLLQTQNQKLLAAAIADGIGEYLGG